MSQPASPALPASVSSPTPVPVAPALVGDDSPVRKGIGSQPPQPPDALPKDDDFFSPDASTAEPVNTNANGVEDVADGLKAVKLQDDATNEAAQSAPAPLAPVAGSPAKSTPAKNTPVKSTSAKSTSAKSTPAKTPTSRATPASRRTSAAPSTSTPLKATRSERSSSPSPATLATKAGTPGAAAGAGAAAASPKATTTPSAGTTPSKPPVQAKSPLRRTSSNQAPAAQTTAASPVAPLPQPAKKPATSTSTSRLSRSTNGTESRRASTTNPTRTSTARAASGSSFLRASTSSRPPAATSKNAKDAPPQTTTSSSSSSVFSRLTAPTVSSRAKAVDNNEPKGPSTRSAATHVRRASSSQASKMSSDSKSNKQDVLAEHGGIVPVHQRRGLRIGLAGAGRVKRTDGGEGPDLKSAEEGPAKEGDGTHSATEKAFEGTSTAAPVPKDEVEMKKQEQ